MNADRGNATLGIQTVNQHRVLEEGEIMVDWKWLGRGASCGGGVGEETRL